MNHSHSEPPRLPDRADRQTHLDHRLFQCRPTSGKHRELLVGYTVPGFIKALALQTHWSRWLIAACRVSMVALSDGTNFS